MASTKAFVGCAVLALFAYLQGIAKATDTEVFYNWVASFSSCAPLGVKKQVITINGQFPGPTLAGITNDVVHVNLHNNLSEPLLLTWNGVQLRRDSWQNGVQGTNCPIPPGHKWTYTFQLKDQIGSFFYFPSIFFQKAAGGYGPIRVYNRPVIPVPFPTPTEEIDILIGDWYDANHMDLRASLDRGKPFPSSPDGILINGKGPNHTNFTFLPGGTYRLRISNVGLKTSLNFRIQNHMMQLVEVEGSYTIKQYYHSLDIHVGQSYSVLITANQSNGAYYMVASSRFIDPVITGIAVVRYAGYKGNPVRPLPPAPDPFDYTFSRQQAESIRWDLAVGAARPNPQGTYHYGEVNISRTVVLQNDVAKIANRQRYTVNSVSFVDPGTPLKLADYFQLKGIFTNDSIPSKPDGRPPALAASVLDVTYRHFVHFVFENTQPTIQSWHIDGYNFWVVGMDTGTWNDSKRSNYNLVDALSRSTFQVYPKSWTAILMSVDNQGMWNIRSQDGERAYLGQQLYIRVKLPGEDDPSKIPTRDELPIPSNVIKCGKASTS